MAQKKISICIHFVDVVDKDTVYIYPSFTMDQIGDMLSDERTLNLNMIAHNDTEELYTIVYSLNEMVVLKPKKLALAIKKIIITRFPNDKVEIPVFAPISIDKRLTEEQQLMYIRLLGDIVLMINQINTPSGMIGISEGYYGSIGEKYKDTTSKPDTARDPDTIRSKESDADREYRELCELGIIDDDDERDIEYDEDDEDEDDEDYYDDDDDIDPVEYMMRGMMNEEKNEEKNKKKHSVRSSRVLKSAKDQKKSFRRHGVIACSNKNSISKDKETIKKFIKEFIPGNSEWKKDLRRRLLSRWMKMYTMTNKKIRTLDHEYKKAHRKHKKSRFDASSMLDYSRRLFGYEDNWSNPNK